MDGGAGGHCDHPEWTMPASQLGLESSLSPQSSLPFFVSRNFPFFPPEQYKPYYKYL